MMSCHSAGIVTLSPSAGSVLLNQFDLSDHNLLLDYS